MKRCKEIGDEIRSLFSNKVAATSGEGNIIELDLGKVQQVDQLVIQEDIRQGERIREFVIEYFSEGEWKKQSEGTCVGHKRILQFQPITASKLRLWIRKSIAEPIIANFSAYHCQRSVAE